MAFRQDRISGVCKLKRNGTMIKILILIVSYNAEHFVQNVLARIPGTLWKDPRYTTDILVLDDSSTDGTFASAERFSREHPELRMVVLTNARNQGYGGNQKIGYYYAIENGYDDVVLLHGGGQYAPEYLPNILEPLIAGDADAVFGSRMVRHRDALKGGMPLYKWLGNQLLTACQNRLLGTNLQNSIRDIARMQLPPFNPSRSD